MAMIYGINASPNINITSYLRLSLIELINRYPEGGRQRGRKQASLKDGFNVLNRELMQKLVNAYACGNDQLTKLLSAVRNYMDEVVNAFKGLGYEVVIDGNYVLLTRLAIGLRHPYTQPLEPSIAWDPYWNLPYIPASSLKGAIRAIAEVRSECVDDFGKTGEEGEASHIVILDAYPVHCGGRGLLTLDIINPHYREVEGAISEVESNPTPLVMLTVSRGVAFRIVVLTPKTRRIRCGKDKLSNIVSQALNEGLGAKTALGYGRLEEQKQKQKQNA